MSQTDIFLNVLLSHDPVVNTRDVNKHIHRKRNDDNMYLGESTRHHLERKTQSIDLEMLNIINKF